MQSSHSPTQLIIKLLKQLKPFTVVSSRHQRTIQIAGQLLNALLAVVVALYKLDAAFAQYLKTMVVSALLKYANYSSLFYNMFSVHPRIIIIEFPMEQLINHHKHHQAVDLIVTYNLDCDEHVATLPIIHLFAYNFHTQL